VWEALEDTGSPGLGPRDRFCHACGAREADVRGEGRGSPAVGGEAPPGPSGSGPLPPGRYPGRFKSCAACRKVHYCGKSCQIADWLRHKRWCLVYRAAMGRPRLATPEGRTRACLCALCKEERARAAAESRAAGVGGLGREVGLHCPETRLAKLAEQYYWGVDGKTMDREKAFDLLEQSFVDEGDPFAEAFLRMHREGGIPERWEDPGNAGLTPGQASALAVSMMEEAADAGHPWAQFEFACACAEGTGSQDVDCGAALRWLRRSAASGAFAASFTLAQLYLDGTLITRHREHVDLIEPDLVEGLAWLRLAAGRGMDAAKQMLDEIARSDPDAAAILQQLALANNKGPDDAKAPPAHPSQPNPPVRKLRRLAAWPEARPS